MIGAQGTAPLITLAELESRELRSRLGKIVMAKGVYDLTHYGHVLSLWEAKRIGDTLVVAIADDESVRLRKGIGRPVLGLEERVGIVASLRMVDYVMVYGEQSPFKVLSRVRPHYFCATHFNQLADEERRKLEQAGVELIILRRPATMSTSEIIHAIQSQRGVSEE